MRSVPGLLLASLLLCALLPAGPREACGQAGSFARMGFGARGVAMSNALVADAFGETSPYYNPALAPMIARQNMEATASFLSLDRELQFLQLSTPLRPYAGIAVGLIHAGVSNIDGRDDSGYHTQDYSTDEFSFFLAFGTRLGSRISAGLGLQIFRADYLEELGAINSIGIDAGLSARITDDFYLGFAVEDLLARYAWDTSDLYGLNGKTTTDRFPVRLRLGGAYRLWEGRAKLVAEYESRVASAEARVRGADLINLPPRENTETESLRLQDNRFRLGAEFRLADPFAIRGGVDQVGPGGVQPSAGFMVEQPVGQLLLRAEYAFMLEPYAVGSMHFLTLRVLL